MPTQIDAAVLRSNGLCFEKERLELAEPAAHEVLVKIVATGLCHSDISVMQGLFPPAPPVVLGHEGAGIVVKAGSSVSHVAPGDHVVLSFDYCGHCATCREGHPAACENFFAHNMGSRRPDGSATLRDGNGAVGGAFFGQSSFATFALASARNAIKVRRDAPLEFLGPLGCGIQTGAGAVLNVLRPEPGRSFAVFGCGGVGLAALMGAKIAKCNPIVAIDPVASRLELARSLGATHVIQAGMDDVAARMAELGGMRYVIEATGVPKVLEQAIACLAPLGKCGVLGVAPPGSTITIPIQALGRRKVMGITEGDVDPHDFIPRMVDHFMSGELPIDRLVEFYDLADINQAITDSSTGKVVKPVVRMSRI